MKIQNLLILSILILLFNSCESPSLFGKKVKKDYFTGGQIRSEFIMDDDTEQNGLLKTYGYEGELTSTVYLHNGVKNGMEIGYDKKKRILWKTPYVNGKKHGVSKAFYPNGEVMVSYTYVNSYKEGYAYTYYRDGRVERKVLFRRGKIVN